MYPYHTWMQEPLGWNVADHTWKMLEHVLIPAYVPCAIICFVYNVYIIPILLEIKNVHLYEVLSWYWYNFV